MKNRSHICREAIDPQNRRRSRRDPSNSSISHLISNGSCSWTCLASVSPPNIGWIKPTLEPNLLYVFTVSSVHLPPSSVCPWCGRVGVF